MKSHVRFLLPFLALTAFGAERIGEIEFFGTNGRDVAPIRQALPFHEGETISEEGLGDLTKRIGKSIQGQIGKRPTDIALVCCDAKGAWMIYIGLGLNAARPVTYLPKPAGTATLPADVTKAYDVTMDSLLESVRSGGAEDHSKGYALSSDPELKARQLALHECALREEQALYKVLETSADAKQREIAAHVLGYAPASKKQIAALVRATRDSDKDVRNNATRALWVLADSGLPVVRDIPAVEFIPFLTSGKWADRNKGSLLLVKLSENADRKFFDALREASADLKEMSQWRNPGHASAAQTLLERMGK